MNYINELNLENNKIQFITELKHFKKLWKLNLKGNPIYSLMPLKNV